MKYLCGAVAALLLASSCAKRVSESYELMELASLKAWMKRNLTGQCDTLDKAGVYMFMVEASTNPNPKSVENGKWIFYDLTVSDLAGNIFYTRDSLTAAIEGKATLRTHYVPFYTVFTDPNYNFYDQSLWLALKNMHEGDSAVVYSASRFYTAVDYTGTSYTGGYEGQNSYPGSIPVVLRIRLHSVIDNPAEYENRLVNDYAEARLGIDTTNLSEADTVTIRHYFKITSPAPAREKIVEDSTVNVYYITRFLDGFVIDTNIDTVAHRVWRDYSTTYSPLSYSSSSSSSYVEGMKAVYKMRYTEWCTTVFTSTYGYGSSGVNVAAGSTEIRPYTPLMFELYVADYQ